MEQILIHHPENWPNKMRTIYSLYHLYIQSNAASLKQKWTFGSHASCTSPLCCLWSDSLGFLGFLLGLLMPVKITWRENTSSKAFFMENPALHNLLLTQRIKQHGNCMEKCVALCATFSDDTRQTYPLWHWDGNEWVLQQLHSVMKHPQ